jgi:hypothetical protein
MGGELRFVLMRGEAGVGKSRLGRGLLARHRDATGIVAQAYPLASSAAFGLWIEALDQGLRDLCDDEAGAMCGDLLDVVLATSRPADLAAHDVAAQVLFELDQDALLSRLEVTVLALRRHRAGRGGDRASPAERAGGLARRALTGQSAVRHRPAAGPDGSATRSRHQRVTGRARAPATSVTP